MFLLYAGINHGIGSAADNQFLAMETKAGYTAYFKANDPREANFEVNGTNYGFPLTVRVRICVHVPMCPVVLVCEACTPAYYRLA